MIYISPVQNVKTIKGYLLKYEITTLIDTRAAKFGVTCNGTILKKACTAAEVKYISADKLSESTPPTESIQEAISLLIGMGARGNVLLVGGSGVSSQTNHLAYRIAYELHDANEHCQFIANDNVVISHHQIMKDVPRGGVFRNLEPVSLNTDEGKYMCHLLNGIGKSRLSKHHLLRDFLYSSENSVTGIPNYPEHPARVIEAGELLCSKVLSPIMDKFGPYSITYGYQNREAMEHTFTEKQKENKTSSSPHQWDRGTFGSKVYARVDILPYAVESGDVGKDEFAHWVMHNLDIDLLMQWSKSNVYCITISPSPRRVWLEWVSMGRGNNGSNSIMKMGEDYWLNKFPNLPAHELPLYYPSSSNGRMWK